MDKQKATQNLIDAIDTLNDQGLTNFIIDGTLLGAIREGDFIAHDTDIDIGVMMEEWTIDILAEVFKNMMYKGFILYHSFGIFGKHFELAWYRDGIKVDFFFYYKVGDKIRFNAFLNGGRTLPDDILTYEYDAINFNISNTMVFNGLIVNVPFAPEQILIQKYGEDWKTPKTKWDWANGPKNKIS
jgi:hypothetical protein